jgi:Ca2+/Na+ antiporter
MPRGDLIWFMIVVALAVLFAELQARREGSLRYVCLALVWIVLTAMLIFTAYGA